MTASFCVSLFTLWTKTRHSRAELSLPRSWNHRGCLGSSSRCSQAVPPEASSTPARRISRSPSGCPARKREKSGAGGKLRLCTDPQLLVMNWFPWPKRIPFSSSKQTRIWSHLFFRKKKKNSILPNWKSVLVYFACREKDLLPLSVAILYPKGWKHQHLLVFAKPVWESQRWWTVCFWQQNCPQKWVSAKKSTIPTEAFCQEWDELCKQKHCLSAHFCCWKISQ